MFPSFQVFRLLPFAWLVAVFVCLRMLDFDGYFGQDSYEYLRISKSILAHWESNTPQTRAIYPPGFPVLGALTGWFFGTAQGTLPLLSLFMAFVCIIGFRQILEMTYPSSSGYSMSIYTGLVLVMSPAFVKASQVALSDMTAISCFTTLIWIGLYHNRLRNGSLLLPLAGAFAAVAVSTRLATLVVVPFPCIFLLWNGIRKKQYWSLLLSLLLFGLVVWAFFEVQPISTISDPNHPYSPDHWHFTHIFSRNFQSKEGNFSYFLPNALFVFGVFYHRAFHIFGGLFFLVMLLNLKKQTPVFSLLWIPVLAYLFFMAGLSVQNERYLLLVFPLAAVLLYPGFVRLFEIIQNNRWTIPFLLTVVSCQIFLNYRSLRTPVSYSAFEKRLAMDLIPYQNRTIYSFSVDVALKQRIPGIRIHNLWAEKYKDFDTTALVLFNEELFKEEWKNQNPMMNWESLHQQHHLKSVRSWPNGWALYEID